MNELPISAVFSLRYWTNKLQEINDSFRWAGLFRDYHHTPHCFNSSHNSSSTVLSRGGWSSYSTSFPGPYIPNPNRYEGQLGACAQVLIQCLVVSTNNYATGSAKVPHIMSLNGLHRWKFGVLPNSQGAHLTHPLWFPISSWENRLFFKAEKCKTCNSLCSCFFLNPALKIVLIWKRKLSKNLCPSEIIHFWQDYQMVHNVTMPQEHRLNQVIYCYGCMILPRQPFHCIETTCVNPGHALFL